MSRRRARGSVLIALPLVGALVGCPDGAPSGSAGPDPSAPPGAPRPAAGEQPPLAAAEEGPERGPAPGQAEPTGAAPGEPEPTEPAPAERPRTPDPWDPPAGAPAPAPAEPEPPKEPPHALWERTASKDAVDRFPGIRIFVDERRLEVRGRICLKRCPTLEFAGCTPRGKTHESLVLFECDPKQLHLALIMLGLVPTPQVTEQGQGIALDRGEKVVLELAWPAADTPPDDPTAPEAVDGLVRRRLEDLIYDRRRRLAMPRVGWVFTGSRMVQVPAPPDWTELHEVYAASYDGNVVAVYHDPNAVLDTPLPEGGDDTIYVPFSERVPERGTELVIHLRPWGPADEAASGADPAAPGEGGGGEGQAPAGEEPQAPR